MATMNWLGIDIGGANLKIADGAGYAHSASFPLWRSPQQLVQELRNLIAVAPASNHLAVTMTGELADCFGSKSEGVAFILDAVSDAADGRHARVYLCDGTMVAPAVAKRKPRLAAAANWHALARFAGRYANQGVGLLIDIGSTTVDIIPLVGGAPSVEDLDDTSRLMRGQLVYTGVERSPVCAVTDVVPYRGSECPLAKELFATMRDVYVILGDLVEDPTDTNTADGEPAIARAARLRLARCICADSESFHHKDAVVMAQAVANAQLAEIVGRFHQVLETLPEKPVTYVTCGQGEFLARRILKKSQLEGTAISLRNKLGAGVSRCAAAHAVAVLAREATTQP